MYNINQVTLSGRPTRDPEWTEGGGIRFLEFHLANNRVGANGTTTSFIRCSAVGALAEALAKHLKKGTLVTLTGWLQIDHWRTKNGEMASQHVVRLETFELNPNASKAVLEELRALRGFRREQEERNAEQNVAR